jgi:uroporphyrinogen III methyltransferase/synthase
MDGKITFVGAGCGDPRLLTLRAVEVLEEADLAVIDEGLHAEVIAHLREEAPRTNAGTFEDADACAEALLRYAEKGLHVVRVVHGDPTVFGTSAREAERVAEAGVRFEIVPGIDPLSAAGAFGGISFSPFGSKSAVCVPVTFLTFDAATASRAAHATGPLVMRVEASRISEAAQQLLAVGRAPTEPVTLLESLSLCEERVRSVALCTLVDAAPSALPLAEGAHVLLALAVPSQEALRWRARLALYGRRVLVTRARGQADRMVSMLRAHGAEPILVPAIAFEPPSDPAGMVDAVAGLSRYGCVVFTSANGVERLWAEVRRQGRDARAFSGATLAAIGPGTAAALETCGLSADLVPSVHKGEDLAEALLAFFGARRPRVLLARAEVARDVVPDTLRSAGCEVDVVPVYRTVAPAPAAFREIVAMLEAGSLDCVTFTSTSTVDNVCDALHALDADAVDLLSRTCVASIGPITTASAERRGVRVDVSAEPHTIEGLVAAIVAQFSRVSSVSPVSPAS